MFRLCGCLAIYLPLFRLIRLFLFVSSILLCAQNGAFAFAVDVNDIAVDEKDGVYHIEKDILPIIERNCYGCHTEPNGYGYRAVRLKMDSYDSIIQGTIYRSILIAGDSRRSILNKMLEGRTVKKMTIQMMTKKALATMKLKL